MHHTITRAASAIALSLSLVLGTITATPARANGNGEQIAGILAGLAALYVIGRAIEQHNDRGDRRAPAAAPSPPPVAHVPPAARVAPAQCFRDFGAVRGYAMRCMQTHVPRPNLLPEACLVRVNTDRGPRNLYAGRCLRQNGWTREAGFRP